MSPRTSRSCTGGPVDEPSPPDPCANPPPPLLIKAVHQFNRREFFECHETLEALWKAEPAAVRELYQGVLQVGVAFHHLGRGNVRGAKLMLQRGIEHLRPFPSECQGILVDRLVEDAEAAARALRELEAGGAGAFEPRLVPTLQLKVDD
ncbi:MAG: DUF309 domain-containing protein [Chloroflexi bacterium]|nr:DUF309 domain-containing protein [Chloroflexota bacterium]